MYLVTTNQGNLYSVYNSNKLKLLEYTKKSIFTNDSSLRFIKEYGDDYLIGASDELLIYRTKYRPEILAHIALPGLVDIKDIVIENNFIVILSGLRDSIYILNKELNKVILCFNINSAEIIEFFKERQTQCQEVNSNYLQIFYCPALNNFYGFDRITLVDNNLSIHNSLAHKYIQIDLNNFKYKWIEHDSIYFGKPDIDVIIENEKITDYIEC